MYTHKIQVLCLKSYFFKGSLFRTWRQNRAEDYPTLSVTEKTPSDLIISENKLLDKLNNFIDIQLNEKYTFCWPKGKEF